MLYAQKIYDTTAGWCYYELTTVTATPTSGQTTPNHTNNLVAASHGVLAVREDGPSLDQLILGMAQRAYVSGAKSADFAVGADEFAFRVTTTLGDVTATLPDPAVFRGRGVFFQKISIDANALKFAPYAAEPIRNVAGTQIAVGSTFANYPQYYVMSTGTEWWY